MSDAPTSPSSFDPWDSDEKIARAMTHPRGSGGEGQVWTLYVCEGCGWMSDEYDDDPPCSCDRSEWDESPPEVREVQVVPASEASRLREELDEMRSRWLEADRDARSAEAQLAKAREGLRYILGEDVAGYEAHMRPEEVARATLASLNQTEGGE